MFDRLSGSVFGGKAPLSVLSRLPFSLFGSFKNQRFPASNTVKLSSFFSLYGLPVVNFYL